MKVTFKNKFKFSPDGYSNVTYAPGEHDVSERCAEVAKEAGALTVKAKPTVNSKSA